MSNKRQSKARQELSLWSYFLWKTLPNAHMAFDCLDFYSNIYKKWKNMFKNVQCSPNNNKKIIEVEGYLTVYY